MNDGLLVRTLTVGPLEENAYLVADTERGEAVLVDPGEEAERLLRAVDEVGVPLAAIWLTHAHFDHIGAVAGVRRRFDVPVYLHEADIPLFEAGPRQAAAWGFSFDGDRAPDQRFSEGQAVHVGQYQFAVWHTPGHSPGHVSLVGAGIALVGDCLFAGSVGRSDLPLSNPAELDATLVRLSALPEATRVFPGHGPDTTIGVERRTNPFLLALGVGGSR